QLEEILARSVRATSTFGRAVRRGHADEAALLEKQIRGTQATRKSFSCEQGSSGGMGWADEAMGVRVKWFQDRS
ncbi:unnamed protein product, partial [Tetraodon nigroviridis]